MFLSLQDRGGDTTAYRALASAVGTVGSEGSAETSKEVAGSLKALRGRSVTSLGSHASRPHVRRSSAAAEDMMIDTK